MVERQTPLVLSSTRATLCSVLNSVQPVASDGARASIRDGIRLPAGILRWQRDGVNVSDSKFDSFDDSALVGLSTQSLKRLSINAGSLVVINNIDIGIQRIAQVVVLDPPPKTTTLDDDSLVLDSLHTMLVFPTYDLMMTQQLLAQEVAYLSPMLAFNLGLHVSCLKSLERERGLGEVKSDKGLIDSALHKYFGTDRQMSRGDVFRVYIDWNCGKANFGQSLLSYSSHAQVIAMEPSNERFLRVNHSQTALVLGGTEGSYALAGGRSKCFGVGAFSTSLPISTLLKAQGCCFTAWSARRLGLHVVENSCHSLLASSERKTSTALAQTFNMARRYAPTILLLRHFDVLKNLGSQDGSQGDRVGVASEIASVIRELTEPVSNGEYRHTSVDEVGKFRGHQVLLIASAESTEGLSPTIRRCFSHEIRMGSLNDEQRSEMLSQSLQGVSQLLNVCEYNALKLTKRKVLNSDSEESLPEDDPDSVVVEYVDFIKAMDQLSPSLSHK
ncbi:hypothetical protein F2Q69_00025695 [Brassica cretica]|uniref:ATPase AAA-type core domain-containing protein n=1 Tax=Brassica cretica TaxID=69181 RepID=A0A8S9S087_BRACR|nr:hypothetical protein F2Q69_00025695 [Brassica cretica]